MAALEINYDQKLMALNSAKTVAVQQIVMALYQLGFDEPLTVDIDNYECSEDADSHLVESLSQSVVMYKKVCADIAALG